MWIFFLLRNPINMFQTNTNDADTMVILIHDWVVAHGEYDVKYPFVISALHSVLIKITTALR